MSNLLAWLIERRAINRSFPNAVVHEFTTRPTDVKDILTCATHASVPNFTLIDQLGPQQIHTVGCTFAFKRNKLPGSYLFLMRTNRG